MALVSSLMMESMLSVFPRTFYIILLVTFYVFMVKELPEKTTGLSLGMEFSLIPVDIFECMSVNF